MKLEINIGKKHFWMIMAVIVLLGATTIVFATGYAATMASHATLFADVIKSKVEGGPVTIQDNIVVETGKTLTLNGVANSAWPVVPSGFCVFSNTQTSCPAGWTRNANFDSRTIQGALTPGATGGAADHTHTIGSDTTSCSGNCYIAEGTVGSSSSWPPYIGVIICCKD
jgi:hypothetical protein